MRARNVLAAACSAGALVLGSVAIAGSAVAADGSGDKLGKPLAKVTATTKFSCTAGSFPGFDYEAEVTVRAYRETDGATAVTLVADMSDLPGVVPVSVGKAAITDELVLDLGGEEATLSGSGTTTVTAKEPVAVPQLRGSFTTAATSYSATVKTFDYNLPSFGIGGTCTPTSGAALGTLTIETGPAPSPSGSPSPTGSPSATTSPSASATASPSEGESASGEGSPAKGKATFTCMLSPFNSEFDYPATITVSGYREEEGGDIQLVADMTDIPGISPVQVDGTMDVTLDAEIGGESVTLEGSAKVVAPPNKPASVPRLKGSMSAEGDEHEVSVSAFTFNFPDFSVGAECESDPTVLGKMVVGTEAPDEEPTEPGDTDPTDTTVPPTSGDGSLPKTGGADALPVVVLWAGALALLGVAGVLAVPQVTRRRTH